VNGVHGVEFRLPLLYTFGVEKGKLTLPQLVKVWSEGPARLFGLAPQKGSITPGGDADLVIIDPARTTRLNIKSHFGPLRYNIYDGMEVRGVPVCTIRRGRVVVDNGEFLGAAGEGRFVKRMLPELAHS
jgi:dihydropyrimidinase